MINTVANCIKSVSVCVGGRNRHSSPQFGKHLEAFCRHLESRRATQGSAETPKEIIGIAHLQTSPDLAECERGRERERGYGQPEACLIKKKNGISCRQRFGSCLQLAGMALLTFQGCLLAPEHTKENPRSPERTGSKKERQ